MNRRTFLQVALGAVGGGGLCALATEPQGIMVERVVAPVRGKGSGLDGFRIVALSDFHLHPFTQLTFLQEAFKIATELKPDLLVLLGDYVDSYVEAIDELWPALTALNAKFGVHAVLGNHDCRKGAATVADGLAKAGVEVLRNRAIRFGVGQSQLWLGGVDSVWGQPDMTRTLDTCCSDVPSVLLAHEPDIADTVVSTGPVQIQLSGHSHGGQVNVPGMVYGVLPKLGRKYAFGSYQVKDMFLHTSRGLGTTGVPVRFRSAPEVTEITLVSK